MRKELGKIERIEFGIGGYQDSCIGIHFTLSGNSWGVQDSKSAWDANRIECSEYCKWTEQDRDRQYAEIIRYISGLLADAKVESIKDLKGVPVEATFEGMTLKEWRILKEVL